MFPQNLSWSRSSFSLQLARVRSHIWTSSRHTHILALNADRQFGFGPAIFHAMNFLPIVERELRVSARRGTTHGTRFTLTLLLAMATLNSFADSGSLPPGVIARSAFIWLMNPHRSFAWLPA